MTQKVILCVSDGIVLLKKKFSTCDTAAFPLVVVHKTKHRPLNHVRKKTSLPAAPSRILCRSSAFPLHSLCIPFCSPFALPLHSHCIPTALPLHSLLQLLCIPSAFPFAVTTAFPSAFPPHSLLQSRPLFTSYEMKSCAWNAS